MIHGRVLAGMHGHEVVAVCTRNTERLAEAKETLQPQYCFERYEDLLACQDVDVISITTHWQDHYPAVVEALKTGKHVFVEKPMAATAEQCDQILQAAAESTGKFMVGHICRFDPRVAQAKEAIEQGRIGRVVSMHAKRNLPQAPGHIRLDKISPLVGDGIHDADMMMWFMGRAPSRVYARNIRFNDFTYPDVGWAMLEFDDSAIGVVETNWGLPTNTPTVIDAQLTVCGSEGCLTIDNANTGLSILDSQGTKMSDTTWWPQMHGRQWGVLAFELEYFADCIRCDRPVEVVTAEEAARAVKVMLTCEESAKQGVPLAM